MISLIRDWLALRRETRETLRDVEVAIRVSEDALSLLQWEEQAGCIAGEVPRFIPNAIAQEMHRLDALHAHKKSLEERKAKWLM